jgi:hypothetical protein
MMNRRLVSWVAAASLLAACNSPLDVDPTASIDSGTALSSPRGITLGLNGAYSQLQSGSLYGQEEMVFPDLYADNLDFTGTFQTHREFGLRNLSTSNGAVLGQWAALYNGINRANNLLEAIEAVAALTAAEHDQYRGEALFIRALNYSMLVRYFGDVPLVLTASRGVDSALVARDPAADVLAQIVTDLEEAVTLLPAGRNQGRATPAAANALLARVYLDRGDNALARDKATLVIGDADYSLNANFRTNWTTKNSAESIFELQFSINDGNSQAFWFYPQSLGGRWGYAPSLNLFNAFEAGDLRRDASIQVAGAGACPAAPCRYGFKYFRIANEDDNVPILRLAEMYLIRAEANARLGAAEQTVRDDLDILRNRAGLADLDPVTVTGQAALLAAVLQERRVELAFEGHRFFDLRRHGVATTVLSLAADRLLFPIPQAERDVNKLLVQNNGY